MNTSKEDITILIDKSGSMNSIKDDTTGMIKEFIATQKTLNNKDIVLTIKEFDHRLYNKLSAINIKSYNEHDYIFSPSGWTALYDSLEKVIDETGSRLDKISEYERPGKVVIVVITDGYDNRSNPHTLNRLKEKIAHQQEKYSWEFLFLGANINSYEVSHKMSIRSDRVANWNPENIRKMSGVLCSYMINSRNNCDHGFSNEEKSQLIS